MARPSNICIINGHPDARPERLCAALVAAYGEGARAGGHQVREIDVGTLDFPLVRSEADVRSHDIAEAIRDTQETITWADHIVLVYPLWLGMMPALLKGFVEQVFRYGFAIDDKPGLNAGKLHGKSARIVVTMGMPGFFYRLYYRAHSLKALQRNILGFSGIKPVRATVLGAVEAAGDARKRRWFDDMRALGRAAR